MDTKVQAQQLTDAELKGVDFIVLIDHSGSMGKPSKRFKGKTRLQEVMEDCIAVARLAEAHDDDGITLIPFSSGARVYDGVKSDSVEKVFVESGPRGSTNLFAAFQEAFAKAKSSPKEVIILAYTDGEPDDTEAVFDLINKVGQELGRPKLGITFIQVGDDPDATAFLQRLDGGLKVDVVARVEAAEAETLSIGQLGWLARNA